MNFSRTRYNLFTLNVVHLSLFTHKHGFDIDTQLMDSMTSFRFIEPEVIIREFSMEHLKAMKNQRFDKDNLCLICPVCDKSFQRNSHLKRHLLIHTKEKVRREKVLEALMMKHHHPFFEYFQPFKCDVCDRAFNQSSTMKSHKKSVHSNDKPFLCTVPNCAKSFSVMSNLKMHQKSHSFVKEFPCRHCKRSFKYQTSLQAHEKMHVLESIGKN